MLQYGGLRSPFQGSFKNFTERVAASWWSRFHSLPLRRMGMRKLVNGHQSVWWETVKSLTGALRTKMNTIYRIPYIICTKTWTKAAFTKRNLRHRAMSDGIGDALSYILLQEVTLVLMPWPFGNSNWKYEPLVETLAGLCRVRTWTQMGRPERYCTRRQTMATDMRCKISDAWAHEVKPHASRSVACYMHTLQGYSFCWWLFSQHSTYGVSAMNSFYR